MDTLAEKVTYGFSVLKLNDAEMAREFGCTRERVRQVRKRLGLELDKCECGRKLQNGIDKCSKCRAKDREAERAMNFGSLALLIDIADGRFPEGKLPANDPRGRALHSHRESGLVKEPVNGEPLELTSDGETYVEQVRARLGGK